MATHSQRYDTAPPSGSQAMRTKQGELLLCAFLAPTGVQLSADIHSTSATSCKGYRDADNKSSNHSNPNKPLVSYTVSFYISSPLLSPHAHANSPSEPAPVTHTQSPRGAISSKAQTHRGCEVARNGPTPCSDAPPSLPNPRAVPRKVCLGWMEPEEVRGRSFRSGSGRLQKS